MRITAAALALVCLTAQASDNDLCYQLAVLAGTVAQARDEGLDRARAVELVVDRGVHKEAAVQIFYINLVNTVYVSTEYSPQNLAESTYNECEGERYDF